MAEVLDDGAIRKNLESDEALYRRPTKGDSGET